MTINLYKNLFNQKQIINLIEILNFDIYIIKTKVKIILWNKLIIKLLKKITKFFIN